MKNLNDSEKYCVICFANEISNPNLMFFLEEDLEGNEVMLCEICHDSLIDQQE